MSEPNSPVYKSSIKNLSFYSIDKGYLSDSELSNSKSFNEDKNNMYEGKNNSFTDIMRESLQKIIDDNNNNMLSIREDFSWNIKNDNKVNDDTSKDQVKNIFDILRRNSTIRRYRKPMNFLNDVKKSNYNNNSCINSNSNSPNYNNNNINETLELDDNSMEKKSIKSDSEYEYEYSFTGRQLSRILHELDKMQAENSYYNYSGTIHEFINKNKKNNKANAISLNKEKNNIENKQMKNNNNNIFSSNNNEYDNNNDKKDNDVMFKWNSIQNNIKKQIKQEENFNWNNLSIKNNINYNDCEHKVQNKTNKNNLGLSNQISDKEDNINNIEKQQHANHQFQWINNDNENFNNNVNRNNAKNNIFIWNENNNTIHENLNEPHPSHMQENNDINKEIESSLKVSLNEINKIIDNDNNYQKKNELDQFQWKNGDIINSNEIDNKSKFQWNSNDENDKLKNCSNKFQSNENNKNSQLNNFKCGENSKLNDNSINFEWKNNEVSLNNDSSCLENNSNGYQWKNNINNNKPEKTDQSGIATNNNYNNYNNNDSIVNNSFVTNSESKFKWGNSEFNNESEETIKDSNINNSNNFQWNNNNIINDNTLSDSSMSDEMNLSDPGNCMQSSIFYYRYC